MGPWGRGRRYRSLVALVIVVAVPGLSVAARSDTTEAPDTPGAPGVPAAGPVTDVVVQGDTAEITALPARLQVVFLADDVFRIRMAAGGAFTDPANTPPVGDGPGANIVVKR